MDLTLFLIAVIIIVAIIYFIKVINELRDDIRKMKVCANVSNKDLKDIYTKEKFETSLIDGLKKLKDIMKN
jgi:hypothetical protein